MKYSKDMADSFVPFSHDGLDISVDRLKNNIGDNAVAKNITGRQLEFESVLESWLESIVHKQNIEADTNIGIARSKGNKIYFTQIFLLKKPFKK
ncbi:MAG: CAP domain-containing protein [Bacteroidales bacterium]|nr:CAP domain-containing protein [Bacteroidales bacterium]